MALTDNDMSYASTIAAKLLTSKALSEESRLQLLGSFLVRGEGGSLLAEELKKQSLSAQSARELIKALFSTGRSDTALFGVLYQAMGETIKSRPYSDELVQRLAQQAVSQGDFERGKAVFKS